MTITMHPWHDASTLAALHACRSQDELEREFAEGLRQLLPGIPLALCVTDDGSEGDMVRFALGEACPARVGEPLDDSTWPLPADQRLAIRYRSHVLGELLVGTSLGAEQRRLVETALTHYGTALVTLTLNHESQKATDNYCASLAALEEGIVLFQEEDPAAVNARLLSLASSMVAATASALYVLREVGKIGSGLRLEQALGIPESMLAGFHAVGGSLWPDVLLGQPAQIACRDDSGAMAMLAPECVPAILQNLVVMPLRYHGVEAGVCLLFNPDANPTNSRDLLGRLQSLGQLGAALLHRLHLEAMTAANRSIERELQIAETIQQRFLPSQAPATEGFEFSWRVISAQNIGGDYLDLLGSGIGDIHAVVADASGHGIDSALLMSSFRSSYRGTAARVEPNELAAALNGEVVHEVGPTGMFITAAFLRLEQTTRRITLCSAGHNPTLLFRSKSGKVESIESHGPPLGFLEGATYTCHETRIEPGDVLMLYTDGITEAANEDLDMFGEERLGAILREHATAGAEAVLAAARRGLVEFTGRERYDDDVSLMVIKAR